MSHPVGNSSVAPWYQVPNTPILSVEHPCIIQNVNKAVQMLGGAHEISQCLEPNADKPLGLSFQPDDPSSRTVISYNRKTNNLLLKFTVPKRTERKRKRGSDQPFVDHSTDPFQRRDSRYLLRSLRDNPHANEAEVVGVIRSTHVWRTMPDYVYSSKGSTFLSQLQTKILPQKYPRLKQWSFPRTYGLSDPETIPPPVWSTHGLPLNYTYRQNPAVRMVADPVTGKPTLRNIQAPKRLFTIQCHYDDEKWPDAPHPSCVPLSQLPEPHQRVYNIMKDLFEERPIWTRRALLNHFPDDSPMFLARHLLAYVAFAIRSGPWRDTLCKLGVDPRTDRSYRKYQSILIQLVPRHREQAENRDDFSRVWVRSKDKMSHTFTGKQNIPPDGKVWQLCDLQDPQLKRLIDVPDIYIRHECERRYFGWYQNGTIAKLRIALKAKVDALVGGEPVDEAALERFLRLPERFDASEATKTNEPSSDPVAGYLPNDASKKELEWASAFRALCRTLQGSLPAAGGSGKGRLSKTKPSTRPSFIDAEEPRDTDELDAAEGYGEPEEGDDGLNDQEHEEDDNPEDDLSTNKTNRLVRDVTS
ncbi:hypothetical protein A1O3_00171 [Capronia epimyces CBS 606.96]|uniref:Transcription factor IIIC subunit 5 HTH domain-containing protein n=1 Tax=Capronia epimyces CBS 606.96 TaxID=1182542 RepID=W9YQS9_9EURO|nr:uncharacterized protein A1O3_00171 [Capronia epimyces CBS 606.96]EXJ91621.1 hypothetical protein A1O3_00171 [Capronia epimyces CBS 606.96]